jgi:hypothetical protein
MNGGPSFRSLPSGCGKASPSPVVDGEQANFFTTLIIAVGAPQIAMAVGIWMR